ncbi:hypothetical protein AALC17_12405 [Oscillospiraceae bacterium 38-13]
MRRLFAAVRGISGAVLGAYLAARLFLWTLSFGISLTILAALLACPAAYLGYWCFQGLRRRRFAYAAVWLCAFLALPLAMRPKTPSGWLSACIASAVCLFASRFLGRESFLRYIDLSWYQDPRRIAARYGGGRSPNRCGPETGAGLLVPAAFAVNEGGGGRVLRIQGDTIHVEPRLRRGRTFSVQDTAGVVSGPSCNVLYDSQFQALAWFRTGEKNGALFARYLRDRGVPFHSLNQLPRKGPLVPPPPPVAPHKTTQEPEAPPEITHTDLSRWVSQDFTLELRRTKPVGVWIAAGLALGLAVFFVGFPVIAICGGPWEDLKLKIMMILFFGLTGGPWVLAAAVGELFTPKLSVESGHIWLDKDFFPLREILLTDIGGLRYDRSDECYILYDKQEKTLAKFSTRDTFGPQFLNFLTDHNIRLRQ